ncbi:class I adenylate-forming enzyme family protein [Paraburkholderia sp. 35.1]|uniref:class I adenylate-forming enzyme family protein n=1 Tax=Paraburkholderia sp. 35.1 TaxID=2991058 RepID=UPI003D1F1B0C
MHNSVGEFITRSAQRHPDKVALIFEHRSWTFSELDNASSALAAGFERLGLVRGDCITLYAPNCPEWIIGYYAAVKIGAVLNPLNSMLTAEEAAYAMNDCGARAVVGAAEKIAAVQAVSHKTRLEWQIAFGEHLPAGALSFAGLLEEVPPASKRYPVEGIGLDDPCSIGYTSGTTGNPKGALLSHRAIVMNTAMTAVMHVRTAQDIVVSALPCTHVYGNIVMHTMLAYGGTLVLHRMFDAAQVLESIQRHCATLLEGVPTMYMYLLNFPRLGEYDLASLKRGDRRRADHA